MNLSHNPRAQDYLSFQLGGLEYGVDFRKVKQLRSLVTMERVAADGAVVGGVALSRGVIMPIVDMREAMQRRGPSNAATTDVIVLQLADSMVGLVVDGVTDVVKVGPSAVKPMPHAQGAGDCDYLLGLAETGGRRLILVDIDRLMSIQKNSNALEDAAA
ncbi:MAG: chemotaxis protein CheW [Gammaproteobacteria bacterium]